MINLAIIEFDSPIFISIAATILLGLQLLLCFKLKKTIIKIIPAIILFIITIVFIVLTMVNESWDALGFLLLSLFTGGATLVCILGLLIWIIVKAIKKKRSSKLQSEIM